MKETTNPDIPSGFNLNAFLMSLVLYAAFICLLYLIKISYTPPLESELGLDLNYGVDLVGSGNLQTLNQANDKYTDPREMAPPASVKSKEVVEVPSPPVSQPAKSVTKVTKVVTTEVPDAPAVPVPSKDNKVVKTETPKAEVSEPVKKKAISGGYNTPGQPNSNGTVGTVAGKGGNNNGDDVGKVGDKGTTTGTPNGKVYYPGNPGTGGAGGASVSISGWRNKNIALPKDGSSQTGEIVFKIAVDDLGQVIAISRISSTVSPSVENFYKDYLTKNLKQYLIADGNPPPRSEGRITIVIKSGN